MIRLVLLCSFLFNITLLVGQSPQTVEFSSQIKSATVYLKSAAILRQGKTKLSPGITHLQLKGLSPYIDAKSIKVSAKGEFTVIAVDHQLNYLDEISVPAALEEIEAQIKSINKADKIDQARLSVLTEKKQLLSTNRNISGTQTGVTVEQLAATLIFYDEQLSLIKMEELEIKSRIESRADEKIALKKQIATLNDNRNKPTGEIQIKVEAEKTETAEFKISYLVSNAGWYPAYDIRAIDIDQPLQIIYKAQLHQNTGVEWDNIQLKFSNGTPNKSGQAPNLNPWRLNYSWNTVYKSQIGGIDPNRLQTVSGIVRDDSGAPLIGASIRIQGTTVGTVSDINGRYTLALPNSAKNLEIAYAGYNQEISPINSSIVNVNLSEGSMLDEVIVTGMARKRERSTAGIRIRGMSTTASESQERKSDNTAAINPVTVIENTTTVEFSIDKPYSLNSGSKAISVDLQEYSIAAEYQYYAVPKIEQSAFLVAKISNWDQYNLLEGEANLYFEDTYIGRSILNAKSLTDTLEISLGRDQNILINRKKVENYNQRRNVGGNQIDSRSFEILVRNKKSKPINIQVIDQVPVSAINDITVDVKDISGGKYTEATGEIIWKMIIEPNNQVKKIFEYQVKYPKKGDVILE